MTTTETNRRWILRGASLLAAIVLSGWGLGCASAPATQQLTLESTQHGKTFTQEFSSAYITRSKGGDQDVVLVDHAADLAADGKPCTDPVRQVMHIRIMWNPKSDQKFDHSSASNATLHWYVLGNTPQTTADVLEYAGTAFVTVDEDGQQTLLTIRNANLAPVACRGALCDPVGTSVLRGSIVAVQSRQRVTRILSSVRTSVVAAGGLIAHPTGATPESPSSLAR